MVRFAMVRVPFLFCVFRFWALFDPVRGMACTSRIVRVTVARTEFSPGCALKYQDPFLCLWHDVYGVAFFHRTCRVGRSRAQPLQ